MIRDCSTMDQPVSRPRFTRQRLVLIALAVLLVVAGVVLYPSLRRWSESETSVDVDRVRIGTVTRGDLVRDVSVEGRVVAAFHPTLFSPAPGIVSVTVRAGQVIDTGQELGQVASPELESRLGQERSRYHSLAAELDRQQIHASQIRLKNEQSIDLLEVELEAAERAMARAERSRTLGIVNAVEYEKAQDDLRISRLRLEHARRTAALENEALAFEVTDRDSRRQHQQLVVSELERQVEELVVRSPVAGLVSRVHVEDREAVAEAAPLFTVVDLSSFEVEIAVSESYAVQIDAGTEAVITVAGAHFYGQVKSISPEVDGSRVMGIVAFTGDTPQGLKQNQRLTTRLILETRHDVLKVPRGPFLEHGGGRQVYVINDGLAVQRTVEVGSLSVSEVEIVSGLEAGDQIIVSETARFNGATKVLLR
jgi:HlyD family secretion protein